MSRRLDDLDPTFKLKAFELIARCVEAGIQIMIVDTLRTQAEHEANLASGHSWINHSLHLDGLAIDIAPYDTYQLHGPDKLKWDGNDPVWGQIGVIGKSIGLKWGGDWIVRDLGHFQ